MGGIAAATLSIAVIASLLLFGAGVKLATRPDHRKQGLLMIVAALVILANVLIWTV